VADESRLRVEMPVDSSGPAPAPPKNSEHPESGNEPLSTAPEAPPTAEHLRTDNWLSAWIGQWVAERWFAWRASRQLLDLRESIQRDEPQLSGRSLYERVVIRRSGLDIRAAAGVLRRAEQSFCEWPSGRDLRFRDLAQYVVIDEYLRSHAATVGTHTNMAKIVARVVPEHL